MSFEYDLAKGFGELLEAAGIGVWDDQAAYSPDTWAITYRATPDAPSRLITLSPYLLANHTTLSSDVYGLQVVTRGEPDNVDSPDDDADLVFNLLHGAEHLHLSTGIHVSQVYRQSSASLGADASRRWSRTSNFYCDVHRPSTHRT